MPRATRLILIPVVLTLAFLPRVQEPPLLGFTAESARAQRELEARFDAQLSADTLDAWVKRMSSGANHVGSPHGLVNAQWMAAQLRSWGFEVRLDTFLVLFPVPLERSVEMTAPVRYRARLDEPALREDATSSVRENMLPPYNAYSADGDVEGELVYVNYGIPADYDELERRGIDVSGKIVIARYGGSWRGIKPKVAAEHGAIGCILYSDPRDDGYFQGDAYPEGAWRMEWGAQRGSVSDMPLYPGDPLTPGVGAIAEAERYTVAESPTVMKIPVLPLSWGDAKPLLEQLGGPVAPESWRGALPITYHLGPGPARVRVRLRFDWSLRPARNVIAVLRGSELADEWVLRGNHFDAWVFGADDPLSGMVALLEEARAVGTLARSGWRPKRTIVYAGWDAEEPGLLGSTEWAEHYASELRQKAVAYINTDGNGRGFLNAGGSHTLERFVTQIARDVQDPQTEVSVSQRARARAAQGGDREALTRADLRISPLGSGSDYTPFLQHLGIASLNLGYGGEDGGGSYHSAYDSYDHYRRFGDPGFVYGVTLAKTAGRATLRLANADVLPLRFGNLAARVREFANEVISLADDMREETAQHNAMVAANAFRLAADPTREYVPPGARSAVPHLNFAPLHNALARLERSAAAYDSLLAARLAEGRVGQAGAQLDALLMRTERTLTDAAGLPRRPWFRHQIYAPGFYTGYGVKTLPGIREGIEERAWDEVVRYVDRVAGALERTADAVDAAAELLR
jgi:N-acetylated-alpha-linked acidic dipeptidase